MYYPHKMALPYQTSKNASKLILTLNNVYLVYIAEVKYG